MVVVEYDQATISKLFQKTVKFSEDIFGLVSVPVELWTELQELFAEPLGKLDEFRSQTPSERMARAAGWVRGGDGPVIFHNETWGGDWKAAVSWSGESGREPNGPEDRPAVYDTWAECCEMEEL
jgi:hypothetical protein